MQLSRFYAVVDRCMEAGDPAGTAAAEHSDGVPVRFQDVDSLQSFFCRCPTVAQKVRRTDGILSPMAPVDAASSWTLPNQRPRDVFEFFTRASPNCAK